MPDSYHIVLVRPPGYPHSDVFWEQKRLLEAAFRDLGVTHSSGTNAFEPDRVNIVLGYHLLQFSRALLDLEYVPYQFEQLGDNATALVNESTWKTLRHASRVWDYSTENIAVLHAEGIEAVHLPVGYHEALEVVPTRQWRDIPLLFGGSISARRNRAITRVEAVTGRRVHRMFGRYGQAKQMLLARATIHLHIHFGASRVFQQPRVAHLWNNGHFVLIESCVDNPYPRVAAAMASEEEYPYKCLDYLADSSRRLDRATRNRQEFRDHYHMTVLLERALRHPA